MIPKVARDVDVALSYTWKKKEKTGAICKGPFLCILMDFLSVKLLVQQFRSRDIFVFVMYYAYVMS